jgi:hypothetical protein
MRTRRRATIEDLRLAIDCLPQRTRIAMLQGISANDIIVGAYTSGDGICPMLAAHRNGGRTSLIAFAQAWDRVAFRGQRSRSRRPRRATERELLILRSHLEASLLADDAPTGELAKARSEHEVLLGRRVAASAAASAAAAACPRPGDAHRAPELGRRSGWAWTRVVRRYDDYQRILARLDHERAAVEAEAAAEAEVAEAATSAHRTSPAHV